MSEMREDIIGLLEEKGPGIHKNQFYDELGCSRNVQRVNDALAALENEGKICTASPLIGSNKTIYRLSDQGWEQGIVGEAYRND